VRQIAAIGLRLAGFAVLEAESAEQALDLFQQRQGEVAAAVIDLRLPDKDGLELLALLRSARPGLPCVLTSGAPLEGELPTGSAFLPKPFTLPELSGAVQALLPG
jgi:two-component system cell cycle sensor histidine kinase/response regulator CckA